MKDTRHLEQDDVSGWAWVKMNVEGTDNSLTKQRALLTKQYTIHPSLDVAVNSGGYTIFCGCAVAVDFVKKHLQTLRKTTKDIMCVCAAAEYLPFRPNAFRTVIATELIEHVESPDELLQELSRVGQRLIITTPLTKIQSTGHVRLYTKKQLLKQISKYRKPIACEILEE